MTDLLDDRLGEFLHLLRNSLSQQACWFKDKDQDKDNECKGVLIFTGYICRPKAFQYAEQKPSQYRSLYVPYSSEYGCSKCLDAGHITHVEVYKAIIHRNHDTC